MIDFDMIQFVDSNTIDKEYIKSAIEQSENSSNKNTVRDIAKKVFSMLAPSVSCDLLMGSTKDFNKIKATEEEAMAGIHVFRAYFADRINRINREITPANKISHYYDKEGVIAIEDFLESDVRTRIIEEINKFPLAVSKTPSNTLKNLDNQYLKLFSQNRTIKELVMNCLAFNNYHQEANRLYLENTFVQRLHNKKGDGDVQKILHSDTFFPCIKWWYFPNKVDVEDGPFAYVIGSHTFTESMARFIYEQSILITRNEIDPKRTYGHAEGSLRLFEEELEKMGLKETKFTVEENTLVVANVHGFHRRSEVIKEESFRDAIHGSIRVDTPFS